ncbi:hypothetical protein [Paracoccus onubensis]|uniref:Uncharacterized protein n=1 Tax=Paracoccus onubensis TaxID=1675788 RepID=A0A418SWW1_9RHOB|nr:hypothetical protein [Paracoccus onubensis]RJE85452.1 hypothetical protein D3P04_10645 [Paracoccus onubensis]
MTERAPDWDGLRKLFARLRQEQAAYDPDLARDLAEERAAIMEFDGGLDRREAEARAGVSTDYKNRKDPSNDDD